MSFFQRLRNALSRFMYGRNGADQLGVCMIWGAILLDLAGMLIKKAGSYPVLSALPPRRWPSGRCGGCFPKSGKAAGGKRRLFAEDLVAR